MTICFEKALISEWLDCLAATHESLLCFGLFLLVLLQFEFVYGLLDNVGIYLPAFHGRFG
jgi:hypothetical protein